MLIPLSLEFCEVKHHVRSNFQIVNYSVTENIIVFVIVGEIEMEMCDNCRLEVLD